MAILGRDYDSVDVPDLSPYIATASNIVDQLRSAASTCRVPAVVIADTGVGSTSELIERWLSAHVYTKSDPVYTSRSTAGASGSFVRGKNEPEPYKDMAIGLDPSKCLRALLNNAIASAAWLGKPVSGQIDYDLRD